LRASDVRGLVRRLVRRLVTLQWLIKQINPHVPVILSTGFDAGEEARRFPGLKPQGFLQKPYTNERLVEAIADTLKRPTD
jgi:DNA-binding NtrC family response regulator